MPYFEIFKIFPQSSYLGENFVPIMCCFRIMPYLYALTKKSLGLVKTKRIGVKWETFWLFSEYILFFSDPRHSPKKKQCTGDVVSQDEGGGGAPAPSPSPVPDPVPTPAPPGNLRNRGRRRRGSLPEDLCQHQEQPGEYQELQKGEGGLCVLGEALTVLLVQLVVSSCLTCRGGYLSGRPVHRVIKR